MLLPLNLGVVKKQRSDECTQSIEVGNNLMNCEVHAVYKNPRYRILSIDDKQYIVDAGRHFWNILFPFFHWIFPNRVFKVDDPNIIEKLKSPETKRTNTGNAGTLGAGIGIALSTLVLEPLSNYLKLPSTPLVNAVILMIVLMFMSLLYVTLKTTLKKNLYHVVNLDELSTDILWIRPRSIMFFFRVVFAYVFFMGCTALLFWLFIAYPDVIMLIMILVCLLLLSMISFTPIPLGYITVKFKDRKKTAV